MTIPHNSVSNHIVSSSPMWIDWHVLKSKTSFLDTYIGSKWKSLLCWSFNYGRTYISSTTLKVFFIDNPSTKSLSLLTACLNDFTFNIGLPMFDWDKPHHVYCHHTKAKKFQPYRIFNLRLNPKSVSHMILSALVTSSGSHDGSSLKYQVCRRSLWFSLILWIKRCNSKSKKELL